MENIIKIKDWWEKIYTNREQENKKGCRTCKFIDCDGKEPCITCGDGNYINYKSNNQ